MKKYDLIYFMGDSWTVARGQSEDLTNSVNLENRWTGLVSKYFRLPEINEAIAGCGNRTIFQKVYQDIYSLLSENKKPLVVVSYTDPDRVELWNSKYNQLEVLSNSTDYWNLEFYKIFLTEYHNRDANNQQSITYILAIKTLLEKFNLDYVDNWAFTPILENKYFNTKTQLEQTLVDIAGDEGRFPMPNLLSTYGHANVYGNQKIANKIIQKISQLYDT